MTDQRIKELMDQYVDAIIKFRQVQNAIEDESERTITICDYLDAHIGRGIYRIARVLGAAVVKEYRQDVNYPYCYRFMYRELEFYQREKEPLKEETDVQRSNY